MSTEPAPGLDDLLDWLESAIARLADGGAPLEQLVAAYEEANRLAAAAEVELGRLEARLAGVAKP